MTIRRTLLTLALGGGALAATGCAQPQPVYVQAPAPQPVVAAMPTRVCDTSFRVINNSGMTVQTLQFSHSSLGGWGADQLGANVLPPGRMMNFRAANTGNYDFRAMWANGRAVERYRVNVCTTSNVIITNGGIAVN
jgi:hypothetical protein